MRKLLTIFFITACLSVITYASETMYVSSNNGLRLRMSPGLGGTVIKVLPYNTEVTVEKDEVGSDKKWSRVKVDDESGYVFSEFIEEKNEEEPDDSMEYLGNWRITAYAYTGSPCANGNYPSTGYTVACNSLDFGATIYIEGVGIRVVEDRGPSYLGSGWCDLYLGDTQSCIAWGDQYRDVYLVR